MLKYVNTEIVFQEIPDETTLAINISNCPCHCKGCHSSYLAEDIGKPLVGMVLRELIENNRGITCVSFMGGDSDPTAVNLLAEYIKNDLVLNYVKVAWYSGRQELSSAIDLENFDFIKLGPYIEELGGLKSPNTNQRLYKIVDGKMVDITNRFWENV